MPDLTPTEIVGDALAGWVRSMGGDPGWLRPYGAARVVLDALTAAGRLLPEGGQTRTEWRSRYLASGNVYERSGPFSDPYTEEEVRATVAHDRALGYAIAVERRAVTNWPDKSTFTGPWVAVDQETTDAAD